MVYTKREKLYNKIYSIEVNVISLKAQLSSDASRIGDWAVIKCYEAKLQNKEPHYDLDKLLADRQAARDTINEKQAQIAAIEAEMASMTEEQLNEIVEEIEQP